MTHIVPWYAQCKVAQVALFNVNRQSKLVQSLLLEFQVLQSHIAGPDTDVKLRCVQIIDIGLEEAIEQARCDALEPRLYGLQYSDSERSRSVEMSKLHDKATLQDTSNKEEESVIYKVASKDGQETFHQLQHPPAIAMQVHSHLAGDGLVVLPSSSSQYSSSSFNLARMTERLGYQRLQSSTELSFQVVLCRCIRVAIEADDDAVPSMVH